MRERRREMRRRGRSDCEGISFGFFPLYLIGEMRGERDDDDDDVDSWLQGGKSDDGKCWGFGNIIPSSMLATQSFRLWSLTIAIGASPV